MTITVIAGAQAFDNKPRGIDFLTQSTGTGLQSLDPAVEVHNLGMGTAPGFGVNRYLLATDSAHEGREMYVQATATGEAYLVFSGTSTGALVFLAATDRIRLKQFDGAWHLEQNSGATVASATGTA